MIEAMNIPKLRFPEFQDIWASDNLISLSKVKMSNGVFNDPKKVGSGYRLINVKDMYIDRKIDIDTLTFLELDKTEFERNKAAWGDVFFTRSSLVKEGIAFSNIYIDTFEDVTYDGHLVRMRPNQDIVGTFFLSYLLKTSLSRKQLILRGKTTTMTTIGQEDISTVVVSYPTKPEQTKIAAFLTSVDTKIEQLAKKQELLSEYKKGLMEKIFSQDILFKADDGSNFPDWEERRLGDVLSSISTRPHQVKSSNILEDGMYKVVDQGKKELAGYTNKKDKLLINDGVIVYGDHTTIAKFIDYDFVVGADGVKLLTSNINNIKYLYFNLVFNNVEPEGYKRHFSILKNVILQIPSLQEQTKIANFLSSIDCKIKQVGKQLDESKQFKKALLQQMFV